jgi:hypothetical protein
MDATVSHIDAAIHASARQQVPSPVRTDDGGENPHIVRELEWKMAEDPPSVWGIFVRVWHLEWKVAYIDLQECSQHAR